YSARDKAYATIFTPEHFKNVADETNKVNHDMTENDQTIITGTKISKDYCEALVLQTMLELLGDEDAH
ncbi:hypothetical protein J3T00_08575, partial [Staphylococcus aureus]|nr:hypothetical protein [Staphylococcus aureus]